MVKLRGMALREQKAKRTDILLLWDNGRYQIVELDDASPEAVHKAIHRLAQIVLDDITEGKL